MAEREPRRVQEKAFGLHDGAHFFQPSFLNIPLEDPRVDIDLVPHDGVSEDRKMRADHPNGTVIPSLCNSRSFLVAPYPDRTESCPSPSLSQPISPLSAESHRKLGLVLEETGGYYRGKCH